MMRPAGIRFVIAWGLAALVLAAGPAEAQVRVLSGPLDGPPRIAVLLFISGSSTADLPAPVGEVRIATRAALETEIERLGVGIIPRSHLVPLLEKWRVRSSHGFGNPFLEDLVDQNSATHLMVATLLVAPQHLQLLVRVTDLATGTLIYANALEQKLDSWATVRTEIDAAAWFASLSALCRSVNWTGVRAVSPLAPMLLLPPTRGIACDTELSNTANHCLLGVIVETGRWRVPDPALLAAELRSVGVRLDRIDGIGRKQLTSTYDNAVLLQSELVAYGVPARNSLASRFDSDEIRTVASGVDGYELSISVIAPDTGVILAARTEYQAHGIEAGWFGVVKAPSLLQRFQKSAHTLWLDVITLLEDT